MPTKTHYLNGDNYQLRQVIFAATPKAVEQTRNIAQKFKGASEHQTAKNIFDFLKTQITYQADTGHQKVKLPSALLRERVGDCKSYSLFTAAILTNLGIGWKYVLTSYRDDPTPTHIYVITDSGIIIDAVWGQFDSEKPANHKFYHKPDMRISTITGLNGSAKTPESKIKPMGSINSVAMNDKGTLMKINGKPQSNSLNSFVEIGASQQRAYDWFKEAKGREPKLGEKAEWTTKNVALAPARELVLQVIKANGGGIASMINQLVFATTRKFLAIPDAEKKAVAMDIEAKRIQLGSPILTPAQRDQYLSVKVSAPTSGGGVIIPSSTTATSPTSEAEIKSNFEKAFGVGTYDAYLKYFAYKTQMEDALVLKYSIPPTSPTARKQFAEMQNTWFWRGGDPFDIIDAVKEGATKSPKGKDFNYVIRKAVAGDLKFKDIGLLVRGISSVLLGEKFSLGDSGTYTLGQGISGEPVTSTATIMAYAKEIIGIIMSLMGLFAMFKGLFGKDKEDENDLFYYLTNGWITKEQADTIGNVPVLETKVVKDLNGANVTIVKPDPEWLQKYQQGGGGGGMDFAGFGGFIVPLLVGGAVIMALNTSKKGTVKGKKL
jgi:hypothetical protein